jgi:diguanylate cyclase (GGDEF)-like protein/PAS domain S-box-containing protein
MLHYSIDNAILSSSFLLILGLWIRQLLQSQKLKQELKIKEQELERLGEKINLTNIACAKATQQLSNAEEKFAIDVYSPSIHTNKERDRYLIDLIQTIAIEKEIPILLNTATQIVAGGLAVESCQIFEGNGEAKSNEKKIEPLAQNFNGKDILNYYLSSNNYNNIDKFPANFVSQNIQTVSYLEETVELGERPWGILGVYTERERIFTPQEKEFLQTAAKIIAIGIQNNRHQEQFNFLEQNINSKLYLNEESIFSNYYRETTPIIYANLGFDRLDALLLTQICLDSAPEGVFWLDAEGRFCYVNNAVCEYLNYSRQELLTMNVDTIDGNPRLDLWQKCWEVGTNKKTFQAETCLRKKDGSVLRVEINSNYIKLSDRDLNCVFVTDLSHKQKKQEIAIEAEESFLSIFDQSAVGIIKVDLDGKFLEVNTGFTEIVGYTSEELQDLNFTDITHPEHIPFDLELLRKLTDSLSHNIHKEKRYIHKNGSEVWCYLSVSLVRNPIGEPKYFIGVIIDISDHKRVEQALWESEQRLEGILSSIDDVVWSKSAKNQQTLFLNCGIEKIYGHSLTEFFENPRLWLDVIHPEDIDRVKEQMQILREKGSSEIEHRIIKPNGEIRWLLSRSRLIYDGNDNPIRIDGINTDVTERKHTEEQLRKNAFYDPLTNLPNRALFMDRLQHAIRAQKRRESALFAVLFLDLDDFKMVNDSLGHTLGDKLLQAIARKLQSCIRPRDTLARLGGDEFTILLLDITNIKDAISVAERIHRELNFPFKINTWEFFINTSIGIALSNTSIIDEDRGENLLRDADTAMYRAKAMGKARYAVFNQNMHQKAIARLQLETDLRRAIEREELKVHYQPKILLNSGQIAGFEALIRWQHPERGLIYPGEFIQIAEETGSIIPMGKWLLLETCTQIKEWQKKFGVERELKISVNISGKQLREANFVEELDRIIAKTKIDTKLLILEITESILLDNVRNTVAILEHLKNRHIQVSIDDFGTGYSSLSYLQRFPVNNLKIDRSFIQRIGKHGENSEIVRAIINLAHTLGMYVVAEGIETEYQLAILKSLGCDRGQGFLFSKPLKPEAAAQFILDNRSQIKHD